jgi:hypothetical protein
MAYIRSQAQFNDLEHKTMARGLLVFKQSDVRRALRATRDAGFDVARGIEIDVAKPAVGKANEWDTVLAHDPPAA